MSLRQSANALRPMLCTLEAIVMLSIFEKLENALLGIAVTPSSTTAESTEDLKLLQLDVVVIGPVPEIVSTPVSELNEYVTFSPQEPVTVSAEAGITRTDAKRDIIAMSDMIVSNFFIIFLLYE